jgi:hypothetical protein
VESEPSCLHSNASDCLKALAWNKLRSARMMLGMIAGMSAVFASVALGEGASPTGNACGRV